MKSHTICSLINTLSFYGYSIHNRYVQTTRETELDVHHAIQGWRCAPPSRHTSIQRVVAVMRVVAALLLPALASGFAPAAQFGRAPCPVQAALAQRPVMLAKRNQAHVPQMLFGRNEPPVQALRSSLFGIGWFSWWSQAILSTISSVLLLFANSVSG